MRRQARDAGAGRRADLSYFKVDSDTSRYLRV
jgi:hypothetical protein